MTEMWILWACVFSLALCFAMPPCLPWLVRRLEKRGRIRVVEGGCNEYPYAVIRYGFWGWREVRRWSHKQTALNDAKCLIDRERARRTKPAAERVIKEYEV